METKENHYFPSSSLSEDIQVLHSSQSYVIMNKDSKSLVLNSPS